MRKQEAYDLMLEMLRVCAEDMDTHAARSKNRPARLAALARANEIRTLIKQAEEANAQVHRD